MSGVDDLRKKNKNNYNNIKAKFGVLCKRKTESIVL